MASTSALTWSKLTWIVFYFVRGPKSQIYDT